jgi:hypothetical protein
VDFRLKSTLWLCSVKSIYAKKKVTEASWKKSCRLYGESCKALLHQEFGKDHEEAPKGDRKEHGPDRGWTRLKGLMLGERFCPSHLYVPLRVELI